MPGDIPLVQRLAAQVTHWALDALLIVQPLLGWMGTSAYPAPVPVFGLFDLPPHPAPNRALSEQLLSVHRLVGFTIVALATLHIGAALFHHFGAPGPRPAADDLRLNLSLTGMKRGAGC